jgi:glutaredoxin 3
MIGIKYVAFELDLRPDGQQIQDYLLKKSGQRTVPNIFVKKQHLGGCDDLHTAHGNGKLIQLLK